MSCTRCNSAPVTRVGSLCEACFDAVEDEQRAIAAWGPVTSRNPPPLNSGSCSTPIDTYELLTVGCLNECGGSH